MPRCRRQIRGLIQLYYKSLPETTVYPRSWKALHMVLQLTNTCCWYVLNSGARACFRATPTAATVQSSNSYSHNNAVCVKKNSLEKSIMLGMGGGSRKRGKPRARWLDDINAVTNCTLTELCGSAIDRNAWMKIVMVFTRSRTRLYGIR